MSFPCESEAQEPGPLGGSGARVSASPGLKRSDNLDTYRSKSSNCHLPVVRAASSLYPRGCGETNGNGQAQTNLVDLVVD